MKKIVILIIFGLAMCNFTYAQSLLVEIDRLKEIKLLESNREDVRKILADYDLDISDDSRYYQWFSTKNAHVMISYSSGNCSEDSEEWNVPEWKVIYIEISPKTSIAIKDIGIDYSKFSKERMYGNIPRSYIYHNKDLGIAFEVDKNKIKTIYLVPPKKDYSLHCDNKKVRKFYSSKSWFGDSKLKERQLIIHHNYFANVVNLILSQTEIIVSCPSINSTQNESCSNGSKRIAILVSAKDPEKDVLIYHYEVSGGKIIGRGSSVVWDLSSVEAGTYTITATADDGCGFCGKAMTKTVIVKECPDCQAK